MSARKPAAATAGAKPDNNNESSPTLELDALQGCDDAAAEDAGGTAAEDTAAAGGATATADTANRTATPTDKDQETITNDGEKHDEEKPSTSTSPSASESGTPRKTSMEGSTSSLGLGATKNVRVTRHSSPLLLSWSPTTAAKRDAGGACSDSEELPSGSQRKSSAERQSGSGSGVVSIIRGRKSIKELKEAKEAAVKLPEELLVKEESSDAMELDGVTAPAVLPEQDAKESKDTKDNSKSALDAKSTDKDKESKEKDKEKDKEKEKDKDKESTPTPTPTATTPTTTCNRVTRKAHAQELALATSTRVTRNRRQSSTVNTEPQLPARGRRKKPAPPDPKELLKRKRSDDDAELGLKYAKVEVKVEDDDHDLSVASAGGDEGTTTTPATATAANKSTLSIKLELPDSEEQATPAAASSGVPSPAAATPTQLSVNRRGRGRPQTKATPTSSNTSSATSTRATRYSKAGSPGLLTVTPTPAPAESTASKRRRVGSANRSLLAAKAASVSTSSLAASSHGAADEDSKDSLASSMDDLLAAAEIKQEKIALDFEENFDGVPKAPAAETAEAVDPAKPTVDSSAVETLASTSSSAAASNGIEPLTVDIDMIAVPAKTPGDEAEATTTAGKEAAAEDETESNEASTKAPSLSPELISEGVSAISVKQFYQKPEFLANNLGIEKDPELGEIVQIATETETTTTAVPEPTVSLLEAEVEAQSEAETNLDGEGEAKLDDSYSTGMGELRMDESGDETDQDAQKPAAKDTETEKVAGAAGETVATAAKEQNSPSELNGDADMPAARAVDDYDDIESDIMQQLAKEGVVDASGNAISASKHNQDQQLATMTSADDAKTTEQQQQQQQVKLVTNVDKECEEEQKQAQEAAAKKLPEPKVAKEVVLSLQVAPFTVEQEAEANAQVDDDREMQMLAEDCAEYPEENKENVSTAADEVIAPVSLSHDSAMDIDLALKVEESVCASKQELQQDHEEEKPLAAIAAEQKTASKLESPKAEAAECEEELRREKELHLQHLGLLTHQAAEQLRQEYIQEAHTRAVHQQHLHQQSGKRSAKGGGNTAHIESSGTLKTVIKLNRSSNGASGVGSGLPMGTVIHGSAAGGTASGGGAGAAGGPTLASATRKGSAAGMAGASSSAHGVRRQSLKMTFQKGRARGHGAADRAADHHSAHAEDSYYTIQNENEGASKSNLNTGNAGRKSNNRFSSTNNSFSKNNGKCNNDNQQQKQHNNASRTLLDSSHSEGQGGQMDHGFYLMIKKDEKEKILIPEKASSFKFHPGRLCEDQCYYCSGKFGLYDTPCHVGQIKSVERQEKILANEEKLTVDNCLCDACFRHVDRRANAPSYKKRLSAPGHLETGNNSNINNNNNNNNNNNSGSGNGSLEKHGFAGSAADGEFATTSSAAAAGAGQQRVCAVKDCADCASHSLRRKCVRKSVKKCLLSFDIPAGTSNVWLCEPHYNMVIQSSGCVLCKRRLGKNHMYHITSQDTDRLEKALTEICIPVQLGVGTAVCKLCRYFANLLMKPPDSTKSQKTEFVKNYRKRLLKVHNLQDGSNETSEVDEEDARAPASTSAAGVPDAPSAPAVCDEGSSTELPMAMDYDGRTDSNSSSSSTTPIGHAAASASKQISKLQAILQQNLTDEATAAAASASSAGGNSTVNVKGKAVGGADISNVLRGNPNISMRELFHGEEDLGVQFKVPFGCSSSQRTPEGWTRVQTFLQYDEPTRRLWEELQKPYGNQSSFLRHLILLEKYYRNGDLVLAAHASSNATVYTQTVRQRLNSYDHGHCGGLSAGQLKSAASANASSCSSSSSSSPHAAQPNASQSSSPQSHPAAASATTVGSVLASALTASQVGTNTTSSSSNNSNNNSNTEQQTSRTDAVIPLVELNDDDDDEDDNNNDKEDDVEFSPELSQTQLDELRSISVDKLTKQLSFNAVTIIARPKESASKQSTAASTTALATTTATISVAPPAAAAAVAATPTPVSLLAEETLQKAPPKDAPPLVPTSGANSRSILKTNLLNKAGEILPLATQQQQQQQHQSNSKTASVAGEKGNKLLDMANKLASSSNQAHGHVHNETPSGALLALQQQQQQIKPKAGAMPTSSIMQQAQQPAKPPPSVAQLLSSPPELISLQRRRTGGAAVSALAGKRLQLPRTGAAAAGGAGAGAAGGAPSVIILPDTLTPQERLESKSWKPTLIPLKEQHKVPNKSPTLFQTADGRRLPAQVQVQSGGKPYLITISDYNRMCILRREKLLRDQMLKANAKGKPGGQAHPPQSHLQQSQQQQQQSHGSFNMSKLTTAQQTARHQLQQLQQQQQQQQQHKHQQQLLPTLQAGGGGGGGGSGLRLTRLAPKPMPPLSNPQQNAAGGSAQQSASFQLVNNALAAAAAAGSTLDTSNSSWLWNNFPDTNQYLLNGNGGPAGSAVTGKLPHLTAKPATATSGTLGGGITFTLKQQQQQQHQQKLIDNVIMSKIPKSLTVIPQHMAGGGGGGAGGGGVGSASSGIEEGIYE
ncbi:hypothetical protein KR222_010969 [Zaprionus bogoriensis]|nr:hypothetical protein KR222_010969 [Zaprionus bogoriensis]